LKIVFATFGSLGDLHPYIAVALALRARGHRPVIATFAEYRDGVEAAGVEFSAMRPDMAAFGDKSAIMARLIDPWRGPEYMVRKMFIPHVRESYEDLRRACAGADLLVTHPLTFAGPLLAQKEGLRWVSTALSPMTMFSAFDPPIFPAAPWLHAARRLGVRPYRLLFRVPRAMLRHWEKPVRAFRTELGLPPTSAVLQIEGQFSPRLHLALFPAPLAAPQPDWPANTVVCGFPRYDGRPPDRSPPAALEEFLAGGDPPLVFALGSSAVMVAGNFWRAAIDAAARLGRRAILITGAPPDGFNAVPPTVRVCDYVPYSTVFPRASVIVHSGGIGTLAQALAAGRPQLIVPVAFDQPDNARRATALGVGLSIPFRQASAQAMTRALADVMSDPGYERRAQAAMDAVSQDGAVAAAQALERVAG